MSQDSSAVESQEDKQKSSAINPLQTESSHKIPPDTENDLMQIIYMAPPTREGTHPDTAWDFSTISIGLFPLPVERVISGKSGLESGMKVVTDYCFLGLWTHLFGKSIFVTLCLHQTAS